MVPHYFNVVFDPDKRSLKYDLSLTTEVSGQVYAYVDVYAFGIDIIQEHINFCNIGWKQFCPMFTGSIEIESIQYIDKKYISMIPGIAFTFPDLDATARVVLVNQNNTMVGCLQSSFSNGRTVSHVGAKWATAVIAGIGLLISSVLSLFGNSASASRMSAMSLSLFTYFQSVIIISMLHVEKIPPIAGAWSENLAWSMGLIETNFMQKIFRWYVQATGGTPTQYLTTSTISVLAQRSIDYGVKAVKKGFWSYILPFLSGQVAQNGPISLDTRANNFKSEPGEILDLNDVQSNTYLEVLRGIERQGYQEGIEPTSIVCTGFTFFVIFLYILVAGFWIFQLVVRKGKKRSVLHRKLESNYSWRSTLKGTLFRYVYIGFPQLIILSLWEFTHVDSGAVAVIAVLFLLLALGSMGWGCYKAIGYGRESVKLHNNAAAILYGNSEVLRKYGFLYTMLDASKYWFCAVMLGYGLIKYIFVALAQKSGKTQAMVIFLLDLAYTIYIGIEKPYLDRPTNIMSICISSICTLNSFFFTFFSGLYNTPLAVASVMGLVYFIINAAFSLILLLYILFFACVVIFSKNPDAKFSPAKDDRASFRKKHQSLYNGPDGAQELLDLGQVARGHDANWASEMYKLKSMVDSSKSNSGSDLKDETKEVVDMDDSQQKLQPQSGVHRSNSKFGDKLRSTLSRGKSMLSRHGTQKKHKKRSVDESAKDESAIMDNGSSDKSAAGHDTIADLEPPQRYVRSGSGHVSIPRSSSSESGMHRHMASVDGSVDTSLYTNEATTPANIYKNNGKFGYI